MLRFLCMKQTKKPYEMNKDTRPGEAESRTPRGQQEEKQDMYEDIDIHKLEQILSDMGAGIWHWHIPSGRTQCTERWAGIVGYPIEEVSPSTIQHWGELVHPGDREVTKETMMMFLEGKTDSYSCEFRMRHKEGHMIWVKASGMIMARDKDGKPLVACGVHQDINKQKTVESELRQLTHEYEKVFDGTQSSMFLTEVCQDGSFRYLRTNRAYERTSGFSPEETMGRTPQDLYGQEQGDIIASNYRKCMEMGSSYNFEADIKLRGKIHTVIAELTPIFEDGRAKYIVGSSIDISDKKKILDELVKARDKADASDRLKTAFLNNISHEIRTPLNGILGFGQLLAQDGTKQQKSHLHNMQISSQRLMDTINKITDISLIISGTMEVNTDRVQLSSLLHDLRDRFDPLCQEEGLSLVFETGEGIEDLVFSSDSELLRKALSHLIDNAVKFTQEGRIVVRATGGEGNVHFSVEDTGAGIDELFLDKLFTPFSQEAVGTTRGYEGSGLGLSIARGIVDLLGGQLDVSTKKYQGSTFSISLPAEDLRVVSTDKDKQAGTEAPFGAHTVLVADDDPMARFLAETLLEEKEVRMLFAADGEEAVRLFRENPGVSVVLMDIKMPVMDGLTATRQVKALRPEVPVIAITAYAMSGDEARIKAAGCNDYVSKPFSKGRLFEAIKKHLPSF